MAKVKRKRQLITDARCVQPLNCMLSISNLGYFDRIPLEHVGFSDDILELLREHGMTVLGDILGQSPAALRRRRYLYAYVPDMLDALDAYFCKAFEEGEKAYREDPVPIYRLLKLRDIEKYRFCLLHDFSSNVTKSFPDVFKALRASGIITVYDFFKMNLIDYHECVDQDDSSLRYMLNWISIVLKGSVCNTLPMPCPVNDRETEVITYPLPAIAKRKVSLLTDDRIAGDDVSVKRLTPYEKALYDRSEEAIEDCGVGFYYDVVEDKEPFVSLSKTLAAFYAPVLELMQRKVLLRNLYMAVPEKFRQMPVRAMYHYMVPRSMNPEGNSPYCRFACCGREVPFFKEWELFQHQGRMMPLEDAYRHLEELVEECGTIEDFDRIMETDGDWEFLDLLHWLGSVSMLTAVYDSFLKTSYKDSHEAPDAMKAIIPEADPDEVIARLCAMKHDQKQVNPDVFPYYKKPYDAFRLTMSGRFSSSRYDFFAVYMLLAGKTSVPYSIARNILHLADGRELLLFFRDFSNKNYLYEYNPDTDSVDMKPHALEW
ncbi:MAG: hypothetical protein LUE27_02740 [Clostridia bacterium]|nr:hypothetical protein [Clostridia bacterium]